MSDEKVVPLRGFGIGDERVNTVVEVLELSDGSINVSLVTKRDGMEPLKTGFRVTPITFELLASALARAAHDPTVWAPLKDPE